MLEPRSLNLVTIEPRFQMIEWYFSAFFQVFIGFGNLIGNAYSNSQASYLHWFPASWKTYQIECCDYSGHRMIVRQASIDIQILDSNFFVDSACANSESFK